MIKVLLIITALPFMLIGVVSKFIWDSIMIGWSNVEVKKKENK